MFDIHKYRYILPIDILFQMYLVRFGYLAPPDPYTGSLVSYEDYEKSITDFQKMVDLPVTGEILFCHIYEHIHVYETVSLEDYTYTSNDCAHRQQA